MKKFTTNRLSCIYFALIVIMIFCTVTPLYSQQPVSDSSFHPYHVNYWVTGSILTVGLTTNLIGITTVLGKKDVTLAEIQSLDRSVINNLDYWVLKLDPTKASTNAVYSDYVLGASLVMPGLLFFDKNIKHDWFDILLMYTETMSITTNIFEWSFLGPTFQNRLRPLTYYEELTYDEKKSGHNRNSFYSGHVASAAASTFFMAKVYSDYHPEIGNNKYFLYAAAMVPPLVLGYFRIKALKHFTSDVMVGIGIGALCGILIPEFHRIKYENITLGLYSSLEATGVAIKWQPKF
ncbi:MAG: PA-phosphatase-like phosphoesterase [Stygiobacter sp.]|nr:MAG: PA-phosphatase-like phosphoesterase [Stygiobacter sp.]KAF0217951.1 MAG: PA-phosphatase-like [Ignavibacteria bacterium]